mmetsp:Transcript_32834/g.94114  ORF Transcript_32834/g.94114 Transcript_32834/m.94114 type:complete len:319 (+) Transcript_32834:468-1424(+)
MFWQERLHQHISGSGIAKEAMEVRRMARRHQVLKHGLKHPEGSLLFKSKLQKNSGYLVHALGIADSWLSCSNSHKHTAKSPVLRRGNQAWGGPRYVCLDLGLHALGQGRLAEGAEAAPRTEAGCLPLVHPQPLRPACVPVLEGHALPGSQQAVEHGLRHGGWRPRSAHGILPRLVGVSILWQLGSQRRGASRRPRQELMQCLPRLPLPPLQLLGAEREALHKPPAAEQRLGRQRLDARNTAYAGAPEERAQVLRGAAQGHEPLLGRWRAERAHARTLRTDALHVEAVEAPASPDGPGTVAKVKRHVALWAVQHTGNLL